MTEQELKRIYGEDYSPMTDELREEMCYDELAFCSLHCPEQESEVEWDRLLGRKDDNPKRRRNK